MCGLHGLGWDGGMSDGGMVVVGEGECSRRVNYISVFCQCSSLSVN